MNTQQQMSFKLLLFSPFVLLLTSCAAGDVQFTAETPAGFWYGLWHGVISFISLIIHLFNETVMVYEANNTGGWYDFGFLLGVIFIWGGGCHVKCKSAAQKLRDKEWEEVGEKVEKKVMYKLKNWAEEEEDVVKEAGAKNKDDWDEISEKVEKKLKRKIREWAEKE
jgi:hypothetical protein